MEILFKDDYNIYYIEDARLYWRRIKPDDVLSNIKHLDDVEPLYHYKDMDCDEKLIPVYYEINRRFIGIRYNDYDIYTIHSLSNYIKDYTLVNLNLI